MYRTRIASDQYQKRKKHHEEMMTMSMEDMKDSEIPVDLYGKRVFTKKDDGNLEKAAKDIQEYYCLTDGEYGLNEES